MKRTFVLAGNYNQFRQWQHKNDPHHQSRYIEDRYSLLGCRGYELVKVGTYYQRPDYQEIIDEHNRRMLSEKR